LSLHDALPIYRIRILEVGGTAAPATRVGRGCDRGTRAAPPGDRQIRGRWRGDRSWCAIERALPIIAIPALRQGCRRMNGPRASVEPTDMRRKGPGTEAARRARSKPRERRPVRARLI